MNSENTSAVDEDFYGLEKADQKLLREFVCFRLGSEWYGIPVGIVREVVEFLRLTPLPSLPSFVCGVFSLRGNILSVVDLKPLLGLPATAAPLKNNRLIVIETEKIETAFLVDEVLQVIGLADDALEPPLAVSAAGQEKPIEYVSRFGEKFIALLNVDKLLGMLVLREDQTK